MRPDINANSGLWRACPEADISLIRLGDEFVAFHRPSGKTHFLNSAMHRLLTELAVRPKDVDTITQAFSADRRHDHETIREELILTLAHLESLGLVRKL